MGVLDGDRPRHNRIQTFGDKEEIEKALAEYLKLCPDYFHEEQLKKVLKGMNQYFERRATPADMYELLEAYLLDVLPGSPRFCRTDLAIYLINTCHLSPLDEARIRKKLTGYPSDVIEEVIKAVKETSTDQFANKTLGRIRPEVKVALLKVMSPQTASKVTEKIFETQTPVVTSS
jgi:hypothetical protein